MKLFIDECLSPQLAARLNAAGRHDAVHPLHSAEGTWTALQATLAFLEGPGKPLDMIVNHVLEIDRSGGMTLLPLPPYPAKP